MKKFLSLTLALILVLSAVPVFAGAASADVIVTISDRGSLAVIQQTVTVTDIDSDGKLTVNDTLYCAHEKFYDGGAAAGYKTEVTQWGLGIKTLWGITNGGSYGYYINNESAYSLADEVKGGDCIDAFSYADAKGYSDIYTFFDAKTAKVKEYESFTLTLFKYAYDENWNAVKTPVSGAVIVIDGKETSFVTDANGKAEISFNSKGEHTVSAKSVSGPALVPPVCKVSADFDLLAFIKYIFKAIADWFTSVFSK